MKKAILLLIGCLAYVSVQAQTSITVQEKNPVSIEQLKKEVQHKIQLMTAEVSFNEDQKTFLKELLVYSEKNKAGIFVEDLKANPIRDVNMDTFFTKEQRIVIQKYQAISQRQAVSSSVSTGVTVTQDGKSKF